MQSSEKQEQQEQANQAQKGQVEKRFYELLEVFYNQNFLSPLQKAGMTKFIQTHFGRQSSKVDRMRPWLLAKINQKRIPAPTDMQKGCPDIIPGLRSQPWWDINQFPWLAHFEQNYKLIRDELMALRNQKGFQPYRGPSWISDKKASDGVGNESIDSGSWNVFYLELHNMKFDYNCLKIPKTMQLIHEHIPNNYHHAFFSALTTKSHIMKHHGPTNKKLRFHLPLMGVSGSSMRVGNETRQQQEGKAYVFDDSFEHQAWHEGEQTRLILIVDFWHPDLSKEEIQFLKVLQNARFKAEHVYSEMDKEGDNFYSIIENAKELIKDNEWWVVKEE